MKVEKKTGIRIEKEVIKRPDKTVEELLEEAVIENRRRREEADKKEK